MGGSKMKTAKEITINHLKSIQHDYSILERAIKIVKESEEE